MGPRVSVIMSVHNNEKYVREAVESVLKQTFADFEFIVFDDGSTDGTLAVLESFNDKRIVLKRNKKSLGLTKTLNKALGIARGEFIARMDGDDICLPERFAKQIEKLDTYDVCGTNITLINEKGKKIGSRAYIDVDSAIRIASPIAHPTAMFRKELVTKYGGYDEQFRSGQDYDLWLRYWSNRARFCVVDEELLQYRIHKTSVKTRNTRAVLGNTLRIKRKARQEYGVRFGVPGWLRIGIESIAILFPSSLVRWVWRKTL